MTVLLAGVGVAVLLPWLIRPRVLAAMTALAILFGQSAEALTEIGAFSYADEGLTLAFVLVAMLARRGPLRGIPGLKALAAFVVIGAVSSLANAVPPETAVLGAAILLKPWIFALGLAQIDWTVDDMRRIVRIGAWLLVAMIVGVAVNMAMGQAYFELWNGRSNFSYRFGIPAPQGLFTSQLVGAIVVTCATIGVVTHGWVFGTTAKHRLLMLGGVISVALPGRRTAIVGGLAGLALAGLRQRGAAMAAQLLLLVPLVIILGQGLIGQASSLAYSEYVVNAERSPRVILHRDMLEVATEYAPVGAGFGRFGSATAASDYSPEYLERGYQTIWGMHESTGNASLLTDTQWPAVFGEAGFLGALAAIIAIAAVGLAFAQASKSSDPYERWLGLTGVAMLVLLATVSIGLPVFFGGCPPQALAFGAVGVLAGFRGSSQSGV
ncbi:hypothetical protein Pve01_76670 [Planomonospora venezuelensis]|nr:hypothetical protein Pve01_76670 [Planomonospora venezuelensis]